MKPASLLAICLSFGTMTFGALTASAAVDPALLALVPPDASMLFGMQVQNVLSSPFGQYAAAQLPVNNGMVMFAAATGFNYQHDLQEIVGASNGGGTRPSLILARGQFQPDKFLALAAVAGATITNFNGTQIFTPPQGPLSVAFLDASTLALGDPDSLKAAIDRYAAHAQFSGPLAEQGDRGERHVRWMVCDRNACEPIHFAELEGPSAERAAAGARNFGWREFQPERNDRRRRIDHRLLPAGSPVAGSSAIHRRHGPVQYRCGCSRRGSGGGIDLGGPIHGERNIARHHDPGCGTDARADVHASLEGGEESVAPVRRFVIRRSFSRNRDL